MRRHHYAIKAICLVLIFKMAIADTLYAAPIEQIGAGQSALQILLQDPARFEAPLDFCSLKEIHSVPGKPLIIHIQDAHANLSGQQNLASTLDAIMSKYKINFI